jgi:hypothetical protein
MYPRRKIISCAQNWRCRKQKASPTQGSGFSRGRLRLNIMGPRRLCVLGRCAVDDAKWQGQRGPHGADALSFSDPRSALALARSHCGVPPQELCIALEIKSIKTAGKRLLLLLFSSGARSVESRRVCIFSAIKMDFAWIACVGLCVCVCARPVYCPLLFFMRQPFNALLNKLENSKNWPPFPA